MEAYKRERKLGEGSFGTVWRVKHRGEGKHYALKMIKLIGIPRKEREACKMELRLMQRLTHPNIVGYKESFFMNDRRRQRTHLCIVMSLCDGGDLSGRLESQRKRLLKEWQILHWFVQICLGLQHMHEENILHRDIKTQNIFLTGNGRIVLGDLGISRVLDGTMDFAKTMIGTPYYMSPEMFKNLPYNFKSDIWALGCVLYEMLTLKHAFDAKSMNGLAQKILRGQYPSIDRRYSEPLRHLVRSMLATKPQQRPSLKDILRKSNVKRHVGTFLRDICGRDEGKISDGTIMVKQGALAAAGLAGRVNMLAPSNAAVETLTKQLQRLGLEDVVRDALAPVVGLSGGGGGGASAASAGGAAEELEAAAAAASFAPGGGRYGAAPAPRRSGGGAAEKMSVRGRGAARGGGARRKASRDPAALQQRENRRMLRKVADDRRAAEERQRSVQAALAKLAREKGLRNARRAEVRSRRKARDGRGGGGKSRASSRSSAARGGDRSSRPAAAAGSAASKPVASSKVNRAGAKAVRDLDAWDARQADARLAEIGERRKSRDAARKKEEEREAAVAAAAEKARGRAREKERLDAQQRSDMEKRRLEIERRDEEREAARKAQREAYEKARADQEAREERERADRARERREVKEAEEARDRERRESQRAAMDAAEKKRSVHRENLRQREHDREARRKLDRERVRKEERASEDRRFQARLDSQLHAANDGGLARTGDGRSVPVQIGGGSSSGGGGGEAPDPPNLRRARSDGDTTRERGGAGGPATPPSPLGIDARSSLRARSRAKKAEEERMERETLSKIAAEAHGERVRAKARLEEEYYGSASSSATASRRRGADEGDGEREYSSKVDSSAVEEYSADEDFDPEEAGSGDESDPDGERGDDDDDGWESEKKAALEAELANANLTLRALSETYKRTAQIAVERGVSRDYAATLARTLDEEDDEVDEEDSDESFDGSSDGSNVDDSPGAGEVDGFGNPRPRGFGGDLRVDTQPGSPRPAQIAAARSPLSLFERIRVCRQKCITDFGQGSYDYVHSVFRDERLDADSAEAQERLVRLRHGVPGGISAVDMEQLAQSVEYLVFMEEVLGI